MQVRDAPAEHRFEVVDDDGTIAGFAVYRRRTGKIAFTHTEVDDAHAGRGVGGRLVREALGAARAEGLAVLPFCPFVRRYIAEHPEELDLVPAQRRAQFGLPAA